VTDSCPKEEILSAFADQALSQARINQIRRHLQICPVCRNKLTALTQEFQQMDAMICSLPEMDPSPGFDAVFWNKVAQVENQRGDLKWLKWFFCGWRPVFAAGVTAVLVTALWIVSSEYQTPTPEEIFIADHMEMLGEFEIIERLDLLENWDAIQAMKEQG
jgi:anti-sigma factor RsiW